MSLWLTTVASAAAGLTKGLEWRRIGPREIGDTVLPLLRSSYVATADEALRLDYDRAALQWMLSVPEAREELRIAIGIKGERSIIGFVCAVPCGIHMKDNAVQAVEVSLLCVHRDWRGRGLTRVLLQELRERAAGCDIHCAMYTSVAPRKRPLLVCACYHRPLNLRALHRAGFLQPFPDEPGAALRLKASLPDRSLLEGGKIRRMRWADATACHALLIQRSRRYTLSPTYTPAQFRHRFLGKPACSLVLTEPSTRKHQRRAADPERVGIFGFISFNLVPLRTSRGDRIVQAQLLGYAFSEAIEGVEPTLMRLLAEAIHHAKALGAHVFNVHGLADLSPRVLRALGFEPGDAATSVCFDGMVDGQQNVSPDASCWIPLL